MFLDEVVNTDPALEATFRFAGQRQRLLAHNIANINTPNFRPVDASPAAFQKALAEALDRPRTESGGLDFGSASEVQLSPSGEMTLTPRTPSDGILAQDRNNTNLERLMQDHAENAMVYHAAAELLRSSMTGIHNAIGERV